MSSSTTSAAAAAGDDDSDHPATNSSDISGDPPATSDEPSSSSAAPAAEDDGRVFLVPYKWWREAEEGMETSTNTKPTVSGVPYKAEAVVSGVYGIKFINNMFGSEQTYNLSRADVAFGNGNGNGIGIGEKREEGGGDRSYALLGADLWASALKW